MDGLRRVAITGMGLVTPLGIGVEAFWERATAGHSAVGPIEHFDCSDLPTRIGGVVRDFAPEDWFDRKAARSTDRYAQFAVAAGELALRDAGLEAAALEPTRVGTLIGSGIGGVHEIEEQTTRFVQRGPGRVSPFFVPKMMINAASGLLAARLGLRGPNFATVTACAAASHAIGMAALLVRTGAADLMLAGGSEAALNRLGVAGFSALRALSQRNDEPARASRPFDRDRDGFVMAEGAGVLVLEELEHAKARGARIYAELAGFGATDDAHHITAPDPEGRGAAEAMAAALADAGLAPEDVGYLSAHATSTVLNDVAETHAIKRAFGEHARSLAIGATKSQLGHLLGAAGAMTAAAAVLAVARGVLLPTLNLDEPDPECDLDYVPHTPREKEVRAAMANAFGFGGHNAALLFRRAT